MARAVRIPAPRFGIGEWYGRSFVNLSSDERRKLAQIAIGHTNRTAPQCPFKQNGERCHKKGGVCSLRLYEASTHAEEAKFAAQAVGGNDGDLRVVCPTRFRQGGAIYRTIGLVVLGDEAPLVAGEVRFLQSERIAAVDDPEPAEADTNEDDQETGKEDVGNIDNVLVSPDTYPLQWCALEIQAVYFSGRAMGQLFRHIQEFPTDDLPFPDGVRRPDYRSSGPKRLMPQLQIKVPTLRRWGKKMAVVVDEGFYRSMGRMDTVNHLSNCDIAWFVIRFDERTDPATIVVSDPEKQTLERAVEGLTGGFPVSLPEFEQKIRERLGMEEGRRGR